MLKLRLGSGMRIYFVLSALLVVSLTANAQWLTGVSSSTPTTVSTTISWNSCTSASGSVSYGTTSAYGLIAGSASLSTSHSVQLTGLTPSTTYHFSVSSTDSTGIIVASKDFTFITAAPSPPPAPVISSGPANPTVLTTATFNFSDTQAGVTFFCGLDGASPVVCSSGIAYSSLAVGNHNFSVFAKDPISTLQSTATAYPWTITTVPPPPPPPGISFIQGKYSTPQGSSTTVATAFTKAQVAGNLNIVAVGWNDTTSTVNSVTDTRGNTYLLAIGPTRGNGLSQSIYYAKNIVAGANTVTVKMNQSAFIVDIRILEYAGLDITNPLDKTAGGTGSGSTTNSGSATTTVANELIFGAGMTLANMGSPGSGFTVRIATSPDADIAEDKIVTTIGSYSVSAPNSGSGWVVQMATFAASPVAPPPPPPLALKPNLSWDPSISIVVGYNVYRSTVSGGGYSKVNQSLVTTIPTSTTPYIDNTATTGTWFYVATAVDGLNQESINSNEIQMVVP